MENPDIDRPAVHIGFPFFAALFVASFFGAPFAAVSAVLLFAAVFLLFLFKQHRQRPNFVLSLRSRIRGVCSCNASIRAAHGAL